MTTQAQTLPGMEHTPSKMERAVEETIQALRDQDLLRPEHEALVQLARELAKTIAAGSAFAKTSVPQAAQQLISTLDALPKPIEAPASDPLADAMRATQVPA